MILRSVHLRRRARIRLRGGCGLLGACLSLAFPAKATPACVLRPLPPDAESTWAGAWRGIGERLRAEGGSPTCSTIELQVRGDRASVVLTTHDGRRAVREVREPFELASTTEAMLLTLDSASTAVKETTPPSIAPTLESTAIIPSPDTRPPEKTPTALSRISIGGLGGARVGGGLATPVIDLFAALAAPPWELGVIGQWEMAYQSLGRGSDQRWSGSGVAAGVTAARHQLVGSQLDLSGGARLEGVVLHQETNHRHPEEWMMKADGRIGVYAAAAIPRQSSIRFRMELAIDRLFGGSPPPASPELPPLSSWGASVAIGVEANGP